MTRRPLHFAPARAGAALALALGAATPAAAQDAGTATATVLRFAPSARALALGGAYAAQADEISIFYNPARLAAAPPAAAFAYRTLPVEAGLGAAALALRLGPGTLGAGAQFLNYGEIAVVEPDPSTGGEWGVPTGERVGGGELVLAAGYGMDILPWLQLGVAAKLLRLQIAEAAATGSAFDFGAGAEFLDGRLALGAAVQNLGGELGPGRPSPLPRRTRAGAALRLERAAGLHATVVAEAIVIGGSVAPATGLELGVAGPGAARLVGRIGYNGAGMGPDPLAAGAGLALDGLALDYAYRDIGLGAAHVFGLSLRLGDPD